MQAQAAPVRLVVNKRKMPKIVGGRYKLTDRIGSGSFGDIYKGVIPGTTEEYAVKLEPTNSQMPQLMYECKLYKHFNGGPGVPVVRWFGVEGSFNIMVMDLLGSSLEDLMTKKKGTICSLKTTIMLADQLISRLEYMHSKDYLHRDIKPDNFLMGRDKRKSVVFVIDLGLSKRYRDGKTHIHIPYNVNVGMTGTVRYASTNSHLGNEQSRRDDLEAMGYVFIYLLTGSLPWQGLKIADRDEKFKAITDMKCNMPAKEMCAGCAREFELYFRYVKSLKFEEKPDYFYMRRLFRTLFIRSGFVLDFMYDWTIAKLQQSGQAPPGTDAPAAETGNTALATSAAPAASSAGDASADADTAAALAAIAAVATEGDGEGGGGGDDGDGAAAADSSPSKSQTGSPKSAKGEGDGEGEGEEKGGEAGDEEAEGSPAQPASAPAQPKAVAARGGAAAPKSAAKVQAKAKAKVQAKAKAGAVAGKKK